MFFYVFGVGRDVVIRIGGKFCMTWVVADLGVVGGKG